MAPLLPQLIGAIRLVCGLQEVQQFEKGPGTLGFQVINDLPGSERLEISDLLGEVFRRCDEVQMILENDIAIEDQPLFVLQESPGIVDDLDCLRPCEDGEPTDNGA